MPFLIYAIDHPEADAQRESLKQAHRDHLKSYGAKILASGTLLGENGKTIIGGISLFDSDAHEEAKQFANDEPYARAGIRAQTQMLRWRKRCWDGRFFGDSRH